MDNSDGDVLTDQSCIDVVTLDTRAQRWPIQCQSSNYIALCPSVVEKNEVDHSLLIFFIAKYWYQESVVLLWWQIPNRNNSKGGNILFYGFRGHSWRSAAFTVSGPVVRKHIMAEGHPEGELPLFWWPRNSRQSCTLEQNIVPKGKVLGTYFLQLEPTSKSFHKIIN